MTATVEVALIDRLVAGFPRAPQQLNAPHESDAELVRMPDGSVLAITTDGIVEEIEMGLYAEPWLAGWMAVTVNASDLAAVGAAPLGMLVCETLPQNATPDFLAGVQAGIRDAALAHKLPILGGDTNTSDRLQLTATALGLVPGGRAVTRRGAQSGDVLFSSGCVGLGAAFAFTLLTKRGGIPFQPRARLAEGSLVRQFASACIDTSDGVLPALHELTRQNHVGFRIGVDVAALLHPAALELARAAQLPTWTMLAGPHGEFELLFTVPRAQRESFLRAACAADWSPLEWGDVVDQPSVVLSSEGQPLTIDARQVADLFGDCRCDAGRYARELRALTARFASTNP